jgi:hypothetical protein
MALLGKVLPMQVKASVSLPITLIDESMTLLEAANAYAETIANE